MANNRPSANNRSRFPHITQSGNCDMGCDMGFLPQCRQCQKFATNHIQAGGSRQNQGSQCNTKHRTTPARTPAIIQRIRNTVAQPHKSIEYDTRRSHDNTINWMRQHKSRGTEQRHQTKRYKTLITSIFLGETILCVQCVAQRWPPLSSLTKRYHVCYMSHRGGGGGYCQPQWL